jgi:membrane protein
MAGQQLAFGDGLYIAGYMAYTGLFALFPFLIFLVALAGFLGSQESAQQIIDMMFQHMPDKVATTLAPAIADVLTTPRGGLLTVGIVGTIWVAAGGVNALRVALNDAYGMDDDRSIFKRYLQSILFVIGGAIGIIVVSVAIILGPVLWKLALAFTPIDPANVVLYTVARYATALAIVTSGLIVLHRYLPARRLPVRVILPGALLTVVLWVAAASGFSLYLAYVADYNLTYGGLGGVALTLVFFYLTGVLFIYGATFNMELLKQAGAIEWHQARPVIGGRSDEDDVVEDRARRSA